MKNSFWSVMENLKFVLIIAVILQGSVGMLTAQEKDPRRDENYKPGYSSEDLAKAAEKENGYVSRNGQSQGSLVPPANDNFVNATVIPPNGFVFATNTGATAEAGEPFHGAGRGGANGGQNNSVWYKYVAPATGVMAVWISSTDPPGLQDSVLSAYTGLAVSSLVPIAEGDDYPGLQYHSKITFGVTAGLTYYIAVDGYGSANGSFYLNYQTSSAAANNNFVNAEDLGDKNKSPIIGITGSNVGASGEPGEPVHANRSGANNSVWYNWTATQNQSMTFVTAGSTLDTILAIYSGNSVNALAEMGSNDDFGPQSTLSSRVTFYAVAGVTYRIAVDGFSSHTGNFLLNWYPNHEENSKRFDFDGNLSSDVSIFRPSNGQWWIQQPGGTTLALTFGADGDRPTPADFTGDGKTDIAIWRPSTGYWYILRSEDFSFYAFPFGTNGDIPATGQFDRDALADPVIFRPSTATWYTKKSYNGAVDIQQFGLSGDVPAVADYDGDGSSDLGIFRPSNGQWWLNRSHDGAIATTFGALGDKPTVGDYTGDGRSDIAFWRPSVGEWFILRSEDSSYYSRPFGVSTDVPASGDYNGDGKFDPTVFRPSTGVWYIGITGGFTWIVTFGSNGDIPAPSAYIQ